MPTYAFLGGGTGGHLFPAIAIAEQLKSIDPASRAVVLSGDKPLDAEILSRAQDEGHVDAFEPIPAHPLAVSPRGLLKLASGWHAGVMAARRALEAHEVDAAIAMGGYVAVPGVSAARRMRTPIALVNLDAVPGRANRVIARSATLRIAAMHETGLRGDWTKIGPIVRAHSVRPMDAAEARTLLGLDPSKRTLLVCGASQGARSVNDFIAAFVREHTDAINDQGWQVLHQTGAADHARVSEAYAPGAPVVVVPFIEDMAPAWAAADLAIARAGAGLVAEVVATRTAAVFMPYPFHKDQHQRLNARPAVEAGLTEVWEDLVDRADNLRAHGEALRGMLTGERPLAGGDRRSGSNLPGADGAAEAARAIRGLLVDRPR